MVSLSRVAVGAGVCSLGLKAAFVVQGSFRVSHSAPSASRLATVGAPAEAPSAPSAPAPAFGAAAALVVVGVGASLRGTRRAARKGAKGVARRALGSIEQFKEFGPAEDKFVIETDKILGVGGQGTVYQCHKASNPDIKYAVKTIPIWRLLMDPSSAEKIAGIEKEVNVLKQVQGHPNIAECLGCFDAYRPGTSQAQYKMMVMELVKGGELAEIIAAKGRLSEDVAKGVFKQVTMGLKFMHDKKVVHRDMKCENILVCGEELTKDTPIKLIDFGVAKNIQESFGRSCVGTTEIMAPELICAKMMIFPKGYQRQSHGPYTFKAPGVEPPGFGIVSQRPDGKGAMVNGVDSTGQAADKKIGDGWAISKINGIDILDKPFIKDFNEMGAGTKGGVMAIAEILGSLESDFTCEFIELPKREFSTEVDMWSVGIVLYAILSGKVPFKKEADIVEGQYAMEPISHLSAEAKDLISKLLQLDPAARLTCDQVLQHPWLKA